MSFKIQLLIISILCSFSISSQVDSSAWPKEITAGSYIIKVYTPENASYIDLRLKSNSAISVRRGEEGKPTFGMVWTTSLLDVDRESRMADLVSITVDEVRFPDNVSEEQKKVLKDILESEIPKFNYDISLDVLIDSMEEVSTYDSKLDTSPPSLIFAISPSVLVLIDGNPKFKQANDQFSIIENSSFFIIQEAGKENYFLKGGDFWYNASKPLGPWSETKSVPKGIIELEAKANQEKNEENEKYEGGAPAIIVATSPSELIVMDGEPNFSPIQNTNLLYVENTSSNLFMEINKQNYYVLVSGRWFYSKELGTTWDYISSDKLPEDFKNIPKDHKKSNVLSNVAGTEEAKDAIYDAQIPQTASVNKDTKPEDVKYEGEPKFEKIKGLELEYALNTESTVFKDGNRYFLCENAIWFIAYSPKGPWKVSEERPEEVDEIPADNPKYNTKYVYIYETTPTIVYVGYTPGYYGSYVYGPTVVYGTGFYYNPWYAGHYYHHHYSYGFSMTYNYGYGWSFGFSFGSPYAWYGHSYWGPHYHWGPPYYRPPYYRPGYRPVPSRPIYRGRDGVNRYQRPNTRPNNSNPPNRNPNRPSNRPNTRPDRPSTQPVTRPDRPSTKPSTRPTNPNNRLSTQPSTRPSRPSTQPSTRPSYPSTRPSNPASRPSTSPSTRPSNNYSRPTTRPSAPISRPAARPAGRAGGMRR